jgi:hypothetical protein
MPDGLWCECSIPLTWREDAADAPTQERRLHEATLVLHAFNQMEAVPDLGLGEAGGAAEAKRIERVEAKLDLALYLLARVLEPAPPSKTRLVRLSPEQVAWQDEAPPAAGMPLLLELHPSPALPLALRLPAVALSKEEGLARAALSLTSEALSDALHQFIFRRHRQAIRDKSLSKQG